ncbi:alpha-tocopherol transfer protein-like [Anopheles cruzii]|uniref:alpha-tocopherol transfer protein-like n=1 Tax=Anopheles cruzii TaxID=68878 RepID=UPI0022EC6DC4|nr:alpha-tocopherol transfer protein-like [Anopheles cruzii]
MSIKYNEKNYPYIDLGQGYIVYLEDGDYTDERWVRKAKQDINETPQRKVEALEQLRELLRGERKLNVPLDDEKFLLKFLRPLAYDVTKAFDCIRHTYTMKRNYGRDYYEGRIKPSHIRHIYDSGMVTFLPQRDDDGCGICVTQLGRKWNTSKISMYDVVALFRINIEASLMDPLVQLNGIRIIFDFDGLSMSHVAQASPKHAMVSLQWIQKCCPLQLKSIHIVNNSMLFNVLFTIFKPFISKDLRDKMFFHNRDFSSLIKCISPKCLPPAYGGTLDAPECEGQLLGDFMQLYDKHYEALDAYGYEESNSN